MKVALEPMSFVHFRQCYGYCLYSHTEFLYAAPEILKMSKIFDLRPNKTLLNTDFEKYQFSSEFIPIIEEKTLSCNVLRKEPSEGQDSWLEARLFGFHNHLFKNPFDSSCWFCDENFQVWQLKEGILNLAHSFTKSHDNQPTYNPTIVFASEKTIVLTKGDSTLDVLLSINDGKFQVRRIDGIEAGVFLDCRQVRSMLMVAMNYIRDVEGKKKSILVILSYSISPDSIDLLQKQELTINGPIEYVYIESSGENINVLSQDSAKFTYDSAKKVQENGDKKSLATGSELNIPKYSWSQDEETLTIWVKIPQKYKNIKPAVKSTPTTLSVWVNGEILIEGTLQSRIDPETTVWEVEDDLDTLRVELMKHELGLMWNELLEGDTAGEWLPNGTVSLDIHSRFSHLCTDKQGDINEQPAVGFNTEQLEECDLQGKENHLQRINLATHSTTHLAVLGTNNRVLFTQKLESCQVLCTRHDHDGCIWQTVASDEWEMVHKNTFPGFGYVEAGKNNKKFCISPPDNKFVAIIEHTRHGFLYERPPLHAKVAKQRIIDLGAGTSPIMGAAVVGNLIILLTKDKLYRLKVE